MVVVRSCLSFTIAQASGRQGSASGWKKSDVQQVSTMPSSGTRRYSFLRLRLSGRSKFCVFRTNVVFRPCAASTRNTVQPAQPRLSLVHPCHGFQIDIRYRLLSGVADCHQISARDSLTVSILFITVSGSVSFSNACIFRT